MAYQYVAGPTRVTVHAWLSEFFCSSAASMQGNHDFQPRIPQNRLLAGICPNPLGRSQRSPDSLSNWIWGREPQDRGRDTKDSKERETSTPVIWTGVIPICRSLSPPAVASLSHGPRDCPASLSHLANDRPMHYRCSLFGLGANPWAKVHQKGRWPAGLLDLPYCKISSPLRQPTPEIRYQSHADKQRTVTDISKPYLPYFTFHPRMLIGIMPISTWGWKV